MNYTSYLICFYDGVLNTRLFALRDNAMDYFLYQRQRKSNVWVELLGSTPQTGLTRLAFFMAPESCSVCPEGGSGPWCNGCPCGS